MASLSQVSKNNRKGWKIQFYGADRRKRVLWLGEMPKRAAEQFKLNVEHLVGARAGRSSPDPKICEWIDGLEDRFIERLVKVGLVDASAKSIAGPTTLGKLLDEYEQMRGSLSPRSKLNLDQAIKCLERFFGPGRTLREFNLADGIRFREWALSQGRKPLQKKSTTSNQVTTSKARKPGLAEATVRKFCQIARQVFAYAAKRHFFKGDNPFASVPTTAGANPSRSHFVSRENAQKLIDNALNAHWRAVIALSRYAALRIPSEITTLRWADVNFAERRLTIRSKKTGTRHCPIFDELLPYLEDLATLANPGIDTPLSALVIPFCDQPEKNLRTEMVRVFKRAGIEQWPRIFHNMRATRQTELVSGIGVKEGRYELRDVCAWLGNSQLVASKHYLMETEEGWARATGKHRSGCSTGCSTNDSTGCSSPALPESPEVAKTLENSSEVRLSETRKDSVRVNQYPRQNSNLRPQL